MAEDKLSKIGKSWWFEGALQPPPTPLPLPSPLQEPHLMKCILKAQKDKSELILYSVLWTIAPEIKAQQVKQ